MPKPPPRFVTKLIGNFVVFGILAIIAVKVVTPNYETATPKEIRAIVDPRLLEPLPSPAGGELRFMALSKAVSDYTKLPKVDVTGVPFDGPLDVERASIQRISAILESGGLTSPAANAQNGATSFPAITGFHNILRRATSAAKVNAIDGKWALVDKDLDFAYLLLRRLRESESSLIENMVHDGLEPELERETAAIVKTPGIPEQTVLKVLGMMPEAHKIDSEQAQAIRGEFQTRVLPRLPDPYKWMEGNEHSNHEDHERFGNYDAKETAGWESAIYASMLTNTERGSHKLDRKWEIVSHNVTKDIPDFLAARSNSGWDRELKWQWYKFRMRLIRNSFGAFFINDSGGRLAKTSLKVRTTRSKARAAVAIQLFRLRNHRDPGSYNDLVQAKILSEVPFDFLADAPLKFDLTATP